jgi:hypothetical protein
LELTMPRGRLAFRENDVARAIRAASKTGATFHVRIERATGDILVLPGEGPASQVQPAPTKAPEEDLDAELKAWRASHGEG